MKFKKKLFEIIGICNFGKHFVDFKYQHRTITAHCPNSGSMLGLLNKGNVVLFSESDNPKRKLKYTLEIVKVGKTLVCINTQLTNKIVLESLNQKKIKSLIKFNNINTEVKFSDKSRFDFLIHDEYNIPYPWSPPSILVYRFNLLFIT